MRSVQTDPASSDHVHGHRAGLDPAASGSTPDWRSVPPVSDDECLALLAKVVRNHDPEALDEVAWLIGRLAVPIE